MTVPNKVQVLITWPKSDLELIAVYITGNDKCKPFNDALADAISDPDMEHRLFKTESIGLYDFWVTNANGIV